jgi:hypothetical protein
MSESNESNDFETIRCDTFAEFRIKEIFDGANILKNVYGKNYAIKILNEALKSIENDSFAIANEINEPLTDKQNERD